MSRVLHEETVYICWFPAPSTRNTSSDPISAHCSSSKCLLIDHQKLLTHGQPNQRFPVYRKSNLPSARQHDFSQKYALLSLKTKGVLNTLIVAHRINLRLMFG